MHRFHPSGKVVASAMRTHKSRSNCDGATAADSAGAAGDVVLTELVSRRLCSKDPAGCVGLKSESFSYRQCAHGGQSLSTD